MQTHLTRRRLLQSGVAAAGAVSFGPAFWRQAFAAPAQPGPGPYGPLKPPDANGIALPEGFSSRVLAQANSPVMDTGYVFPIFPDGQATYATPDGGFILVTNSEVPSGGGGASAIRFDRDGDVINAYRILGETSTNCSGGPTPWGTWMSCEESDGGLVWECDPTGSRRQGEPLPAMGAFSHEAVAVDPGGQHVYLTEDDGEGGFYRFTPEVYPDCRRGLLEIAVVAADGAVTWARVPDPAAATTPTRSQVPGSAKFKRGEGIWFDAPIVYVATTSDAKIHAYDTRTERIEVIYDKAAIAEPQLTDVDNIVVSRSGDLFVCEDPGADGPDVALVTPDRTVSTFLKLTGPRHDGSEATGPIFDPSGRRLYVCSQRAGVPRGVPGVGSGLGVVYEITGPFRLARPASGPLAPGLAAGDSGGPMRTSAKAVTGSADSTVPPSGAGRPTGATGPVPAPALGLELPRRLSLAALLRRGLPVELTLDDPAVLSVRVTAAFTPGRGKRRRSLVVARLERSLGAGPASLTLPLTGGARRRLAGRRRPVRLTAQITLLDRAGRRRTVDRTALVLPPRRRAC